MNLRKFIFCFYKIEKLASLEKSPEHELVFENFSAKQFFFLFLKMEKFPFSALVAK
jgi:hypothetical protein